MFGCPPLTIQISQQRVQLEPCEVGSDGTSSPIARGVQCGFSRKLDNAGLNSKEADEDGGQDNHNHQKDDKRGLGVDVGSN